MDIYFIKKYETWIIREKLLSSEPSQDILFYRSEIDEIDKNTLLSDHYVRITWSLDTQMGNKQAGNVYIHSKGLPFECSEVTPEIEGCYYKAERRLKGENELVITALPYVYPEKYDRATNRQYIRQRVRFGYVKEVPENKYACYKFTREAYNKFLESKLDFKKYSKEVISLEDKKTIVKN